MRNLSRILVAIVVMLLALGIVMLASTSSVKGVKAFQDAHHYIKYQLLWLVVAVIISSVVARVDYHVWSKVCWVLLALSVGLLILVFIPPFAHKAGGSYRWIRMGPVGFQPSELAKFAVVIGLSRWMASAGLRAGRLKEGFLVPLVGLSMVIVLVMLEPDFGTSILLLLTGMAIMFVGGTRLTHLVGLGILGVAGLIGAILQDPVRLDRILAFLWPEKFPAKSYQLIQSKFAFISGGWSGVGLGNSMQKHLYLPEAHTDFILAIIGEELGMVATIGVVLLFVCLFACGVAISLRAPDPFGRYLAFGLTIVTVLQAVINVGVVTGCLPTKGLALPFISYGGSGLVVSLLGMAVHVAEHGRNPEADGHTRPIKDRAHQF